MILGIWLVTLYYEHWTRREFNQFLYDAEGRRLVSAGILWFDPVLELSP